MGKIILRSKMFQNAIYQPLKSKRAYYAFFVKKYKPFEFRLRHIKKAIAISIAIKQKYKCSVSKEQVKALMWVNTPNHITVSKQTECLLSLTHCIHEFFETTKVFGFLLDNFQSYDDYVNNDSKWFVYQSHKQ